jgi:hypothetical protein
MATHEVISETIAIIERPTMLLVPISSEIDFALKARNVLFVFLGIALLVSKQWYSGPLDEIVHAYLGNLSVSFAVYFLFANLEFPQRVKGVLAATCALTVVELFEAFDGFGIMSNTFDPIDYLANAVGIAMAFLIDMKMRGKWARNVKTQARSPKQE